MTSRYWVVSRPTTVAYEGTNSSVQQGTAAVIPNNPANGTWMPWRPSTKLGRRQRLGSCHPFLPGRVHCTITMANTSSTPLSAGMAAAFYRLGNAWKNFGAIGVGWVVSKEDFFDNQYRHRLPQNQRLLGCAG